jgi:hypothetical protein
VDIFIRWRTGGLAKNFMLKKEVMCFIKAVKRMPSEKMDFFESMAAKERLVSGM